jgi:hypothetical protein
MSVVIREITNRKDLRDFINFPSRLHHKDSRWVPPLYRDERRLYDKEKNWARSYCDATFCLAYDDGEITGRIGGIINHRYNAISKERTARFSFIESINDEVTTRALLEFIEIWAGQKGMGKVVGPMGFTDQNPEGLLIEGFEQEPAIGSYMNFKYLPDLVEKSGYLKDIDYVVYSFPVPDVIPVFYERIHQRISRNHDFKLLEFTSRRSLKPYVKPILELMNETFQGLYGFAPMDEQEMDEMAGAYLPVIDPRFVKVVVRERSSVAFILGIPNMNEGFRKARGHLFPTGILRILSSAKKSRRLDLLLGAIKPEYRGRGLDVLLGRAMLISARNAGFETIDSHHEQETNHRIRTEMERLGGQVYKRYRIYHKQL